MLFRSEERYSSLLIDGKAGSTGEIDMIVSTEQGDQSQKQSTCKREAALAIETKTRRILLQR